MDEKCVLEINKDSFLCKLKDFDRGVSWKGGKTLWGVQYRKTGGNLVE